MIVINSVQATADLLALADEIAREEHIPVKMAIVRAGHAPASLLEDVASGLRYRPAKRHHRETIRHRRYRPTKYVRAPQTVLFHVTQSPHD